MIKYRKTKSQQQWVAYGPTSEVRPGTVTITKASGQTKTETIESLGRPFMVDGTQMVYGYLAHTVRPSHRPSSPRPSRSRCDTCRCHRTPMGCFDGCDWCGCDGDC